MPTYSATLFAVCSLSPVIMATLSFSSFYKYCTTARESGFAKCSSSREISNLGVSLITKMTTVRPIRSSSCMFKSSLFWSKFTFCLCINFSLPSKILYSSFPNSTCAVTPSPLMFLKLLRVGGVADYWSFGASSINLVK